jgi:anti-sigma regulatory factor (Ser/Thr protein kinase)
MRTAEATVETVDPFDNDVRAPGQPTVPADSPQVFALFSARSVIAPKICRDFVAEVLSSLGHDALAEQGRLCTSELVTNIVLHAGGDSMLLRVFVDPRRVRVGIYDHASGMPTPRRDDQDDRDDTGDDVAPHGRGLRLVEAMSDSWEAAGADPLGWYAKGIWFELSEQR